MLKQCGQNVRRPRELKSEYAWMNSYLFWPIRSHKKWYSLVAFVLNNISTNPSFDIHVQTFWANVLSDGGRVCFELEVQGHTDVFQQCVVLTGSSRSITSSNWCSHNSSHNASASQHLSTNIFSWATALFSAANASAEVERVPNNEQKVSFQKAWHLLLLIGLVKLITCKIWHQFYRV